MKSLLGFLVLVGLVVHYFWWIAGISLAVWLAWGLLNASEERARRAGARREREAEIAARAEQQDRWAREGDPRGIFGEWTPAC